MYIHIYIYIHICFPCWGQPTFSVVVLSLHRGTLIMLFYGPSAAFLALPIPS